MDPQRRSNLPKRRFRRKRHHLRHLRTEPMNTREIKYLDLQRITQSFEPELSEAVNHTVQSGRYLFGKEVERFEMQFARYCGTKHCVGVANGLDALTLVLMAWKIQHDWNDEAEVIVPANTFIASILAISRARLRPVLCEPDADDYLIDTTRIEALITPRTCCILPVHLYGQ